MAEETAQLIHRCRSSSNNNNTSNNNNNNKVLVPVQVPVVGRVAAIAQVDFRDAHPIFRLMRQVVDNVWPEGFDILVNNAGTITKMALEDDDDMLSSWHETFQVNLHAPRLLSHLSVARMRKRNQEKTRESVDDDNNDHGDGDGGVILQVSSIHGEKSNEYISAYAVSKAALEALARS